MVSPEPPLESAISPLSVCHEFPALFLLVIARLHLSSTTNPTTAAVERADCIFSFFSKLLHLGHVLPSKVVEGHGTVHFAQHVNAISDFLNFTSSRLRGFFLITCDEEVRWQKAQVLG